MTRVRLSGRDPAVIKAAEWLRRSLGRPDYEWIEPDFEQHFACSILREPPDDFVFGEVYAEFDEQSAVAFLLRWS